MRLVGAKTRRIKNGELLIIFQMSVVRWMFLVEQVASVQLAVVEQIVNPVQTVAHQVVRNPVTQSQVRLYAAF